MKKNNNEAGDMCECCCHGGAGHWRHAWLRILIALILLSFVFSAGVKLGEFKASVGGYRDRYDNGMMGGRYYAPFYPMMNLRATPVPVNPSASTVQP